MNKIIKDRWQQIDKKLNKHIILYNNLNLNMQDEIQSVFDGINIPFLDINKPITEQQRNKLSRMYQKWHNEGIMPVYFSLRVQRALRNRNTTNLQLISLMIEASYLRRNKQLNDEKLIKDIAKETYSKEIEKYKGKSKSIDDYLIMLMSFPNPNGYIWNEYKDATTEYYANQMTNQVMINLQQQKELNINGEEFQKILNTEQKRYLNKKKEPLVDKFSGSLDTEISYIVNSVVLRAYIDIGIEQVRFVAVIDERTSEMCKSLDTQVFKIQGKNRFYRYSQEAKEYIEYEVEGLVSGLNLPPINDGFHYCRSTIVAMR